MRFCTKKNILALFIGAMCFTTAISQTQPKQLLITDLGYAPGSRKNVVPYVMEAIKQCANGDATIVFPKGRYDFWQDLNTVASSFSIGIPLKNLKNVVIDGDSSEFIFHGNMQIANITGSENIVLKNFNVDWEFPFMYQATYIHSTDDCIELEFDINQYRYVIENEKFFMTGEGWKAEPAGYFNLFDRDTKEILYQTHDGNNSHLFTSKAVELAPGIVRFYGKPNIKPPKGTITNLMAGRYMTIGIDIYDSKDVYLKDITIYHALSHGVVGMRSENITMDNTCMKINEQKGRVVSVIADASHFANNKGLIKIINCTHTGAMDDFINVHGFYSKIDSLIGNNTVITSRLNGEPGEEIWFVNPTLCQRSETRKIQAIEKLDNRTAKIIFDAPLPKEVKVGDYMENKTWTADLELRNCRILRQHRARGILVTTPKKVVIEDNYFSTAGSAILIEGDMSYWYESGANRDVTIRNNVFDNCLTSGCNDANYCPWGEAIINITPSHKPENEKSEPYHQHIRIENNTFKSFDIPLIHAVSVRGLTFVNNEIIRTYDFKPYQWHRASLYIDGCREVVITGNKIDPAYLTRTIEAHHVKKSDMKVEGFSLLVK